MKTAQEILEEAYSKIREGQSSEHTFVDPIMLEAMETYADQFKPVLMPLPDNLL